MHIRPNPEVIFYHSRPPTNFPLIKMVEKGIILMPKAQFKRKSQLCTNPSPQSCQSITLPGTGTLIYTKTKFRA